MAIKEYLSSRKILVDKNIIKFLPKWDVYTKELYNAVKYSLLTGGKRIRPILALAACEAVSGSYKKAMPMAIALEMIHTYTLIHDDLPAMDDDDIRRGMPTTHKKFGEDIAILAGDMLNTLAFEVIAKNYSNLTSKLVSELSSALGIKGVVGGQVADLAADNKKINMKELEFISIYKTAYLFIASIRCGAIIGGASKPLLDKLTSYALHMGLAFQIIDDILDYKQEKKNNYPALLGLSQAKTAADKELKLALSALPKKREFNILRDIALFLSNRKV